MLDVYSLGLTRLSRPVEARSKLESGWDARPLERLPGVTSGPYRDEFVRKCISLEAGESFTLAEIEGPGLITRLYFTFTLKLPRSLPRGLDLMFFWDEEENPSVNVPLGDFFGSPFCRYREYDSIPQSMLNGGYVSRFPMPFRKRARLVLGNSMERSCEQVFFGIGYYGDIEVPRDCLYFHSGWSRSSPADEGRPHELLNATGLGQYVGCHLYQQNLDRWTRRRPDRWILPGGAGMGQMEGWEEVYVDGDEAPSHHGTGTEEYFNAGPYFTHGKRTGALEGCTLRSYLTGRVAAYRFQLFDPIPFKERFQMIWHRGLADSVRSDFTSVAFWYQDEPHLPTRLPDFSQRRPCSVVPHALRAVIAFPVVLTAKAMTRVLGA